MNKKEELFRSIVDNPQEFLIVTNYLKVTGETFDEFLNKAVKLVDNNV